MACRTTSDRSEHGSLGTSRVSPAVIAILLRRQIAVAPFLAPNAGHPRTSFDLIHGGA